MDNVKYREYPADLLQSLSLIKAQGRTMYDADCGGIFFNWTCSGFLVHFTGSILKARILAFSDILTPPKGMPAPPADLPCIGACADGSEEFSFRAKCSEGMNDLTLYEGSGGEHTVRITKLSENIRGKTALACLMTDGELLPVHTQDTALSIEFVGDSITCGFGNEASGRDSLFETSEENGWMTYGAICARQLHASFNMVSVSGIAAGCPKYPMFPGKAMEDVYRFTDIYCDERFGREPQKWDFAANGKDIVVINLGTNDSGRMWASSQDLSKADEEEDWFCRKYRSFIESVRELNGPRTYIVCTLGPLDFYLYDRISETVGKYIQETGDRRICSFKLIGVNLISEGYGAVSHPSLKTQIRMGNELARRLTDIIIENKLR